MYGIFKNYVVDELVGIEEVGFIKYECGICGL